MTIEHPKWENKSLDELQRIESNIERVIDGSCYPKSIELVTKLLEDIRGKIRLLEKEKEWDEYFDA